MSGKLVLIFVLCLFVGYNQTTVPKHTLNVELGLPVAFKNKAFKGIMQGLVNVSPSYQFCLDNHLAFGAGFRFTRFTVNEFNTPSQIHGGMNSMGPFLKFGHEKFHTNRFATDIGVKYGYTFNTFSTDSLKSQNMNPERTQSGFLEGTIGLILTADEFNSYRWIFSYAIYGFGFKPWQVGVTGDAGYDPSGFDVATQFFTFGFGYTYYIHDRSKGGE